jgi:putative transposase
MARKRPHAYPPEFRQHVVELARSGRHPDDLATEFGLARQTVRNWIKQSDLDDGRRSDGLTSEERYVPTWSGFLFVAIVLDVYSRRVGWAMATHLRTEPVLDALNMAIYRRRPKGVIRHSDQGCQCTSIAFGSRCKEAGVRPSTGSVGDCYDNAMCESFNATLECELLVKHRFKNQREAALAVFDFIEGFYNPRRRHTSIGSISPMEYERRTHAA